MYMRQIKIGPMDNFAYILADDFLRIATVIDPGWPGEGVEVLLRQAEEDGIRIKYIALTHCHNDHAGGVTELVEKTGAEIVIHEEELQPSSKKGFDWLQRGPSLSRLLSNRNRLPDRVVCYLTLEQERIKFP